MLKVLLIPALDDSNIELIKKSCSDMNLLKVNKDDLTQEMIDATFGSSPLRSVFGFGEGDFDHEKLAEILKAAEKTAAEKSQSLKKTAEKN